MVDSTSIRRWQPTPTPKVVRIRSYSAAFRSTSPAATRHGRFDVDSLPAFTIPSGTGGGGGWRRSSGRAAGAQASHAADPAVGIGRLAHDVVGDFAVGQHEEPFGLDGVED